MQRPYWSSTHARRQTGKTSTLLSLQDRLNEEGEYVRRTETGPGGMPVQVWGM